MSMATYSEAAFNDWVYDLNYTIIFAVLAVIAHLLGPAYTVLASIYIASQIGGPLDALLSYSTCDGPSHRQYAELRRHKPSILGFFGMTVFLRECFTLQHVRNVAGPLYLLAYGAWCLRDLWDLASVLSTIQRAWKHPVARNFIYCINFVWFYGTLADDWAWYHRSMIISRYSIKLRQLWIPSATLGWQQTKAKYTRPRGAYEYHSLGDGEMRLLKLQRRFPWTEVTSKLVHVAVDTTDMPSYEAISHHPGNLEELSHTIIVNG